MKKLVRLSGCLLLIVFAGGCMLPTPWWRRPVVREEIASKQVNFITPGSTHREDVIRELGQPYAEFSDLRIMAYTWVMREGMAIGLLPAPPANPGDRFYTLLIAFDSADRVVKVEKMSSWDRWKNVREQALKWVETQDLAVSKVPLVGQVISPGESALYLYPDPGFYPVPIIFEPPPWEVRVNGKVVGWFGKMGEYLAIALPPGAHTVTVDSMPRESEKDIMGIRTSIDLETLPGQAHYVAVRMSKWSFVPKPVLTVRSEVEALPVLKKMKPIP